MSNVVENNKVEFVHNPTMCECSAIIIYQGERVAGGKVKHDTLPTDPNIL